MKLEDLKDKAKSMLESALIGISNLPGGSIIQVDKTHTLFTGQEAKDRVIEVTPFGDNFEVDSKDLSSAFYVNKDGSFNYDTNPRRNKFKKHESYEMMEAMEKRRGPFKRRY